MTESILEVEAQRARWERYRERLGMTWNAGDDFALGGLGAHVAELDARVLVLPADPEAHVVSFDGEAERWLMEEGGASYAGPSFRRSREVRASADAVILYDGSNEEAPWRRHVALYGHGGVEMAYGRLAYPVGETRVFPLRRLVALVWASLSLFNDSAAKWACQSPAELTIGLRETAGATLGLFAEGWAEPDGLDLPATCLDPTVLLRHELAGEFDAQALAMEIGDRLENAFGSMHRRHIARRGEYEGKFDLSFAL